MEVREEEKSIYEAITSTVPFIMPEIFVTYNILHTVLVLLFPQACSTQDKVL